MYIIEQQRSNLCHCLEVELSLLPPPSTKMEAGPRWGKQEQNTQSNTPLGDPQNMSVFNAARQDQANCVAPIDTLLSSPPKIDRAGSHINRSAAAILSIPGRCAGISFAATTKGTAPSPQNQQNSTNESGSKQKMSKPPTLVTVPASVSPKELDRRCLFPTETP